MLEIQELCDIDVIAGADDLLFESLLVGATGWFAGYPNAFPKEAVEIYNLVKEGRIDEARELYKALVAVFRWDSEPSSCRPSSSRSTSPGRATVAARVRRADRSARRRTRVVRDTRKALDIVAARREEPERSFRD